MVVATTGAHAELGESWDEPLPGRRARGWLLAMGGSGLALLALAALAGVLFGAVAIPLPELAGILASRLPGVTLTPSWPLAWETIVWEIRLPRVVLAGIVGGVLGLAGATYQGVFRNPLADPYLIGVAGGAGLGATIAIVTPVAASVAGVNTLPLFAFAGALLAVGVAYALARVGRAVPPATLILAGVAIASMTGALTSFLMLTAGERIQFIFSWLLGGFVVANWNQVVLILPYVLVPAVVLLLLAPSIDVLQLGEEPARNLGLRVERTRLGLLVAASLATAAAVAVSGLIGFVGLIVPHAVRLVVGPGSRVLLPMSTLCGAAFLIAADTVARAAFGGIEVPVGIVTALCGAPFFLWLLRTRRDRLLA